MQTQTTIYSILALNLGLVLVTVTAIFVFTKFLVKQKRTQNRQCRTKTLKFTDELLEKSSDQNLTANKEKDLVTDLSLPPWPVGDCSVEIPDSKLFNK